MGRVLSFSASLSFPAMSSWRTSFPPTKDEAEKIGGRRSGERSEASAPNTLSVAELPERSPEGEPLKWTVVCEATGKPFRLIPNEIEFYRSHGLLAFTVKSVNAAVVLAQIIPSCTPAPVPPPTREFKHLFIRKCRSRRLQRELSERDPFGFRVS